MADLELTTPSITLAGLCQGAVALQAAADPHWDIVNETVGGTPQHRAAAAQAQQLTGAAALMAEQVAAIPAGTRSEVIAKARLVASFEHAAMGPNEALAVSLARDVLLHLGAHPE